MTQPALSDPFTLLYGLTLSGMAVYGWHRSGLARSYLKHKRRPPPALPPLDMGAEELAPLVLVQLPLFNEQLVTERLIEAVCKLEYPQGRLSVQVLDDSTDESAALAQSIVAHKAAQGAPISYHHRVNRVGFKAGALREGLTHAPEAELVAIFDADFIPPSDFLLRSSSTGTS